MPIARTSEIEISYDERGAGVPFVLIAGIGMQLVMWPSAFLDRLAAQGFRVITFDNRDVGLSSKFEHQGIPPVRKFLLRRLMGLPVQAPYTLFDMAGDVVALLDSLGIDRAHVAGVSMGGMIAQAMAIKHADRLLSLTSMMSQSGGRLVTGRLSAMARLVRPPPRSREQAVQSHVDFFRAAGSRGFHRDDAGVAERAGVAYDRSFNPSGFARQFAAILAAGDMRPSLARISTPTLVLHGTDDGIFRPRCGRDTAKGIAGAEFQLIQGWGHDVAEGVWDTLISALTTHARKHSASGPAARRP